MPVHTEAPALRYSLDWQSPNQKGRNLDESGVTVLCLERMGQRPFQTARAHIFTPAGRAPHAAHQRTLPTAISLK